MPSQYDEFSDLLISNHRYEVQSPVKNETFQQFLDYWQNQTYPEINKNNIWEFYLLSNEFGIMNDYITSPQFENIFDISYLIQSGEHSSFYNRFATNFDKSFIEKRIAIHLNEYLVDSPDDLFSIPITSLYNIFGHPERNLQDHESAYRLILNAAENKNQNIYVLLNFLDGSKINSVEIKSESLFQRNNHFGFFPEKILPDEELKNQDEQIQKLKEKNDKLIKRTDQLSIENKQLREENEILSEKNEQMRDENKKLENMNEILKIQRAKLNDALDQLTSENHHLNSNISNSFLSEPGISILDVLGSGSFGQVFLVENMSTKTKFATKMSFQTFSHDDQSIISYIDSLSKIKNPSILEIIDFQFKSILNKNHLILTTKYFSKGSLNIQTISDDNTNKYIILLGIALGMQCLHFNKIVHGNLKLSNIFLEIESFPLISDFGLSKFATKSNFLNSESLVYLAPEILKGEIDELNFKTDVYSYSMIIYSILTGQILKIDRSPYKFIQNVIKGDRPDLSKIENNEIKKLIKKCWSSNPMERPSFYEIIEKLSEDRFISSFSVDIEKVIKYLEFFKSNYFKKFILIRLNQPI